MMHSTVLTVLASSSESSGGSIISFLFLPLILVGAYFLMIRPMRKRQKDQAQLQSAIEVGDEVMTTAGIYGFITGIDDDVVWLEIDDDVQVRVARGGIQRRIVPAGAPAAIEAGEAEAERSTPLDTSGTDEAGRDATDGD